MEINKNKNIGMIDQQIDDLQNELNKLKSAKRRNSVLLEKTVSKHQTGKWKDWRSPKKNTKKDQDIIRERTDEIKQLLENEKDFSIR